MERDQKQNIPLSAQKAASDYAHARRHPRSLRADAVTNEGRAAATEKEEFPTMQPDEMKSIRADMGLTQVEFGKLLGVPKRTVQNWEGGLRAIPGPAVILARIYFNEKKDVT